MALDLSNVAVTELLDELARRSLTDAELYRLYDLYRDGRNSSGAVSTWHLERWLDWAAGKMAGGGR